MPHDSPHVPPHRVIFDTDPGVDDAMALLFAHASRDIELLGVTTTFGNATIEQTTRNARLVVERFDMDCPVHRGAAGPLVGEADPPPDFVHGRDGLGDAGFVAGTDADSAPAGDAVAFIVDCVRAHPHEVTVVSVGRSTNLARVAETAPDVIPLVKHVVVMGGAFGRGGHTGNATPCAEANVHGDPLAADRIMTTPWPLTIVPLDVTMNTRMAPARMAELKARGGEAGDFIHRISAFYRDFYERTSGHDAFPVHDSSAIACLLHPELYERETGAVRVVTEGLAFGQTLFASEERFFAYADWKDLPPRQVCFGVDAEAVLDLYSATLTA